MGKGTIEVQPLTVSDLDLMLDGIDRVMEHAPEGEIEALLTGAIQDKAEAGRIGMKVIQLCIRHAKKELFQVLANASGKTAEEFYSMPAGDAIATAKAVMESSENRDFFCSLRDALPGVNG